jgi:hypothetical membrane protein
MNQRFLSMCGMVAPVLFVLMTILGGAISPGYSHLADTVSELFSPGAPNKLLLDTLHTIFAFLFVLFGIGVLQFVRGSAHSTRVGVIGAALFITAGLVSVATATIYPQDAWGSVPTFSGQMHIILSGVVAIFSMLSMLFLGIWFNRAAIYPGFGTYSFITIAVTLLSAGCFMAALNSPIMGLTERITILAGFLWVFVLARWMYSRSDGENR